jgi:hypothetical protein
MNRQYQIGLLVTALSALLLLVVVESSLVPPLSAVGAEATHTAPAPPGGTATPTATPAARAFAPIILELGRLPTPFVTHTPPAPPPGPTPAGRSFAPAVFELGRLPTPFVTAPPPTVGPTHTPPAPPEP